MSGPYTSATYPLGTSYVDEVREALDVPGSIVSPLVYNQLALTGCTAGSNLHLSEYPRLHLGRHDRLFWTNGMKLNPTGGLVSRIYSMDLNPATACSPPLWTTESSDELRGHINGGGSVQLIYRDASQPAVAHEVFYLIGGATASESDPCSALDAIRGDTLKAVDPGSGASWSAGPSLTQPRVNHNTIILPNGQILVLGGGGNQPCAGDAGSQTQQPILYPEIYSPPEIFPGNSPDAWNPLYGAQYEYPHLYHSVAGLLLDGRVFLAGTAGTGLYYAYHIVEIYSPWYYFSSHRSVIETWPKPTDPGLAGVVQFAPHTFNITVSAPCLVDRVVLMRSAAVTHAFDMNQRYVELPFVKTSGSATHPTLMVTGPDDGFTAPPGFYMLSTIDSMDVPSKGRWVRVGAQ